MADANATELPWLVVTTVGTADAARALARDMVERRLAACAQITAIESIYRWQGAVEHEPEFRLLLKTRAALVPALQAQGIQAIVLLCVLASFVLSRYQIRRVGDVGTNLSSSDHR